MIENYISFDAAKMLKEYEFNKGLLKNLKERLKYLDGTSSVSYDGDKVSSSCNIDGVVNVALQRIKLSSEIASLENDLLFVDACLKLLPQDELIVLHEFFMTGQTAAESTEKLCKMLNLEKTAIYEIRKEGLRRLTLYIAGIRI